MKLKKAKQLSTLSLIGLMAFGLCACTNSEEAIITPELGDENVVVEESIENADDSLDSDENESDGKESEEMGTDQNGTGEQEVNIEMTSETTDDNEEHCKIVILDELPDSIYERYGEEYVKAYEPILRRACEIMSDEENSPDSYDEDLYLDSPFLGGNELTFKDIGFTIQDLSGDGIPELYIGIYDGSEDEHEEVYTSSYLSCMFTLKDGEPYHVACGWGRNVYDYLGNGKFFNSGSSGAASYSYGLYALSKDGTELICEDYYHVEGYDVYYNTTGDWEDLSHPVDGKKLDEFIANNSNFVDIKITQFYELVEFIEEE